MSEPRSSYSGQLAELLGSRPHEVREAAQWHDRILKGLPFDAVENVKAQASLTDAEIARLLGIGAATLRRARASDATLDAATSDRLYRLSRAIAIAQEVLEGQVNAMTWLRRPQPGLRGHAPLDLLLTQAGADEVEALLRRIDYTVYT